MTVRQHFCRWKYCCSCSRRTIHEKKHDPAFPFNAIKYVLKEANLNLSDVHVVAFYDKPLLKFKRLLHTFLYFSPRGLGNFLKAIPIWIKEKLFFKRLIIKSLKSIENVTIPILFPEHHLSHAASAFYPSPFEDAAILTCDGVGEWTTTSIGHGKNNTLKMIKEIHFPHSLVFYILLSRITAASRLIAVNTS